MILPQETINVFKRRILILDELFSGRKKDNLINGIIQDIIDTATEAALEQECMRIQAHLEQVNEHIANLIEDKDANKKLEYKEIDK